MAPQSFNPGTAAGVPVGTAPGPALPHAIPAAASELGISPPAVSQSVKQFGSRLGVALLSRTTRNTHLAGAGERFLEQAGPALDQILAAMQGVGDYASQP